MELLSQCPVDMVDSKVRYAVSVRDPGSGQQLVITSQRSPLALYVLDRRNDLGQQVVDWHGDEAKRPEGVLIANRSDYSLVCFLELKGSLAPRAGKQDPAERAFEQGQQGVQHFCPTARAGGTRSHGDEHHDRWTAGDDLLPVMPDSTHRVVAATVAFRQGGRLPPRAAVHAGKDVLFLSMQVQNRFNRAELSIEELCQRLGLDAAP